MKDKNHKTISTDAEKSIWKNLIPFSFIYKKRMLKKLGKEVNYLNITKAICEKHVANIFSVETWKLSL